MLKVNPRAAVERFSRDGDRHYCRSQAPANPRKNQVQYFGTSLWPTHTPAQERTEAVTTGAVIAWQRSLVRVVTFNGQLHSRDLSWEPDTIEFVNPATQELIFFNRKGSPLQADLFFFQSPPSLRITNHLIAGTGEVRLAMLLEKPLPKSGFRYLALNEMTGSDERLRYVRPFIDSLEL